MGLIYVNPEGPNGNADPLAAAHFIRETFARMAMNDEETVALIAGGHTFGKTHGAGVADDHVGPEPEGAPLEAQGLGWLSTYGSGKGADTITSGLEVTWTDRPTQWSNRFFEILFGYEWELTESPGGAKQWVAKDAEDDHPGRRTTRRRSTSRRCSPPTCRCASTRRTRRSRAASWRTPTSSRSPSPRPGTSCCTATWARSAASSGPWVAEPQLWQDPVPAVDHELVGDADVAALKAEGPGRPASPSPSWSPPPGPRPRRFRSTDKRGGANGARIRLEPQRGWEVNQPEQLATVLETLEGIQREFNAAGGAQISLADLIVLAGSAAVEKAARDAGVEVTVPFHPGRTDATQEQTDVESFRVLEPRADGFRNYLRAGEKTQPEVLLRRPGLHAQPDRARDDRPRRRPALPRRQRRRHARTASSPTGPACSPTTSSPTCSPRAPGGRRRSPTSTSTRSATWPPTR